MDPDHPVDLTNEPDFLPPAWCSASYPGLSCHGYTHADSDVLLRHFRDDFNTARRAGIHYCLQLNAPVSRCTLNPFTDIAVALAGDRQSDDGQPIPSTIAMWFVAGVNLPEISSRSTGNGLTMLRPTFARCQHLNLWQH